LRAFASQGPRLARVLEAFSRAAPEDIALTVFTVEPGTGYWRITAEGQTEGANAAAAQATFNRFLKALNGSPLLGNPITPPSLRVRTEDPAADKEPKAASAGSRLTLGAPVSAATVESQGRHPASVLDFTIHYEVRR